METIAKPREINRFAGSTVKQKLRVGLAVTVAAAAIAGGSWLFAHSMLGGDELMGKLSKITPKKVAAEELKFERIPDKDMLRPISPYTESGLVFKKGQKIPPTTYVEIKE